MEWLQENVDVETVLKYAVPVIGVLVLLIFGWGISAWIGRMTTAAMRRGGVDETLCRFAGKMIKWTLLTLVVLACLGAFGVDVVAFAGILAAMGFAIGLAFQGSLSNFAAGVMLLVFRPFSVGDVISVAGHTAKVDEIDLFVTTMDTFDNRRLIIPNSAIFGATIEKITHHATRRVDVTVGTEYPADIDRVREVLLGAATSLPQVLADPAAAAVLTGLGSSSIDWSVRVWVKAEDFWPVKDALTRAVKYALDEAGIGIPFPQMDVHVTQPIGASA